MRTGYSVATEAVQDDCLGRAKPLYWRQTSHPLDILSEIATIALTEADFALTEAAVAKAVAAIA